MALKLKPLLIAASVALILSGCGESTSATAGEGHAGHVTDNQGGNGNNGGNDGNGDNTFDQTKLLESLVDNVITPTYQAFDTNVKSQPALLKAYCDLETAYDPALEDQQAKAELDEAKVNAQNAWKETMVSWQHAELMILGPLSAQRKTLRNNIYSWPAVSTCSVDQDVMFFNAGEINGNAYDIAKRSDKRRGLDALEYLLFNENMGHSCSAASAGDALSDWENKTEQARKVLRCQFAVAVADDLSETSTQLLYQWAGEDGYANVLKQAGQPGNKFSTTLAAINEISDALFYMTEELKDYKLATPLGMFSNSCGTSVCAQDVESIYAKHSIENIRANIAGFEKIFTGGDAENTGFDDFLDDQGATDTKEIMLKGIADAKLAADEVENLQSALTTDSASVEKTHAKVKDVTDQLKNDFINKLALELPQTSAGDND